jgi:hypothetical protein
LNQAVPALFHVRKMFFTRNMRDKGSGRMSHVLGTGAQLALARACLPSGVEQIFELFYGRGRAAVQVPSAAQGIGGSISHSPLATCVTPKVDISE